MTKAEQKAEKELEQAFHKERSNPGNSRVFAFYGRASGMIKGQKFGDREKPDRYTFVIGLNEYRAIMNLGKNENSSMCATCVADLASKRQVYFFEAKLGTSLISLARELGYFDPMEYMHFFKGKSVRLEGMMYPYDFPGRRSEIGTDGNKVQMPDPSKPRNHGVSATLLSISLQNVNAPIEDAIFPLPRNEWVEEKTEPIKSVYFPSTDIEQIPAYDQDTSFDFNSIDPEEEADPTQLEEQHASLSVDTEIIEDGPEEADTAVEEEIIPEPAIKRRNTKQKRTIESHDPYLQQAADVE